MRITYLGLCAAGMAAAIPTPARADIECLVANERLNLPVATKAISDWTKNRSTDLSPEVYARLGREICVASTGISEQSGLTVTQIDEGSGPAITTYLNDSISGLAKIKPLAGLLEEEFLLGSVGRLPEVNRMAVITIRYNRRVDQIKIGNTVWPRAVARVGSEIGTFAYQGLYRGGVVCNGNIVVRPSAGATVQC